MSHGTLWFTPSYLELLLQLLLTGQHHSVWLIVETIYALIMWSRTTLGHFYIKIFQQSSCLLLWRLAQATINQPNKLVLFILYHFKCIDIISSWIIGRILRSLVSDIFLHFVCTSRESESPLSLLASPVSLCVCNMKYAWDVMSCDDDINCMSGIH